MRCRFLRWPRLLPAIDTTLPGACSTRLLVAFALAGSPAAAADFYGWTISASSTDPFVHSAPATAGSDSLYVWVACTVDTLGGDYGFKAAEFNLTGTFSAAPITPLPVGNVFWVRYVPETLLLAVGGCPTGPLLVGIIPIEDDGTGGRVCFEVSGTGLNVTVDCHGHMGRWHDNDYLGFASDGSVPCASMSGFCDLPTPVEPSTWSRIKSQYGREKR